MLRRYIEENIITIPYTSDKYKITIKGIVIDTHSGLEISDSNSQEIEIFILGEKRICKISWLIAIGYKPVYNSNSFILNWEVLFVDNDENNYHPSNLVWRPPIGGQKCPENENYFVIPGFSYYGISKDGNLYYRYLDTELIVKKIIDLNNTKYKSVSVRLDSGERVTSHQHRVLALAFIRYENNVNLMTVNHIDGIKLNNSLKNLEWVSYSKNNIHALDNGLRVARKIVILKDHFTDDLLEFISLAHASEYLGMNSGWLFQHIVDYPNKPINFRYSARFKDEDIKWPEFSKEDLIEKENSFLKRKEELACMAKNVYTGKIFVASGPGELGSLIGLTKDQARHGLDSLHQWPSHNYIFSYLQKPKEERKFEEDELLAFKDRSGIKNPVRVTFPDGKTLVYISPSEFSVSLGLPPRLIADLLYAENKTKFSDKYCTEKYCVEYIKV